MLVLSHFLPALFYNTSQFITSFFANVCMKLLQIITDLSNTVEGLMSTPFLGKMNTSDEKCQCIQSPTDAGIAGGLPPGGTASIPKERLDAKIE